jgi:hypothetical protein
MDSCVEEMKKFKKEIKLMKSERRLVLQRDMFIPAGTELKEFNGKYEAIIGTGKDTTLTITCPDDREEIKYGDDYFKSEIIGPKCFMTDGEKYPMCLGLVKKKVPILRKKCCRCELLGKK